MNWSSLLKGACLTMTLSCFGLPQANAIEISGGSSAVAHLNDGMISKVVVVRRGGAAHGGVYRGPHGGVYGAGQCTAAASTAAGPTVAGSIVAGPTAFIRVIATAGGPGRAGMAGAPAARLRPARPLA